MPIADLTGVRRFPRLGKIHLGIRLQGQRGTYPSKTDYFVCDNPEFRAVYYTKVTDKKTGEIIEVGPKALDIVFPTENPEDWASQYYRAYSQSRGLVCKGDGEHARRLVFADTMDTDHRIAGRDDTGKRQTAWQEGPCPGKRCPYVEKNACGPMMMLQFMLPKVPGLGIWQLDTRSVHSIININSAISLVKALGQPVALRPLTLWLVPLEVSPNGQRKTVYVLQLDSPVPVFQMAERLMLPAAEDEVPDEADDEPEAGPVVDLPDAEDEVPEDFYPEGTDTDAVPAGVTATATAPQSGAAAQQETGVVLNAQELGQLLRDARDYQWTREQVVAYCQETLRVPFNKLTQYHAHSLLEVIKHNPRL